MLHNFVLIKIIINNFDVFFAKSANPVGSTYSQWPLARSKFCKRAQPIQPFCYDDFDEFTDNFTTFFSNLIYHARGTSHSCVYALRWVLRWYVRHSYRKTHTSPLKSIRIQLIPIIISCVPQKNTQIQ